MTKDEANKIVDRCGRWNAGQTSVSLAFTGIRTQEDDVLDTKRSALKKAWEVLEADND